jgi:choline dehydrogenase-like flavoprotein
MGPADDTMAVVDQHGTVHGLQNIRVVDVSIMPDCMRANNQCQDDHDRRENRRLSD